MTFDSESDKRVMNNVMRHKYRVLEPSEKQTMVDIKDMGLQFYNLMEDMERADGRSRELSLAKTKIEEAVMWAVKHITRD